MIQNSPGSFQILVALDIASDNLASVESAVTLAAHLQAELLGVFVEDTDLLRAAELPFACEVMLWSARERKMSTADVTRLVRALAAQTEEDLARAAAMAQVRWSFRTVRGPRIPAILEAQPLADLLLVGPLRRRRASVPGSVRQRHVLGLVYTGSEASRRALGVALNLVQNRDRHLVVLVPDEAFAALSRAILMDLPGGGGPTIFRPYDAKRGVGQILEAVAELLPEILILPSDTRMVADARSVQDLLGNVGCPVVLVR